MVTSSGSCRTGDVGSVGTVGLVCVSGLLRMGCGPILIPVCGLLKVEKLWEQNRLPWEHSAEH